MLLELRGIADSHVFKGCDWASLFGILIVTLASSSFQLLDITDGTENYEDVKILVKRWKNSLFNHDSIISLSFWRHRDLLLYLESRMYLRFVYSASKHMKLTIGAAIFGAPGASKSELQRVRARISIDGTRGYHSVFIIRVYLWSYNLAGVLLILT